MKRHVALHPLSQHHHFALMEALFIRRALAEPAAGRKRALGGVVRKFLRFWEKSGHIHFREEEEVLLPAYARHVPLDKDAGVLRMLADHAFIRSLIEEIREDLAAKKPVEDALVALGQRLKDHVRLEEDEIFPRIEQALTEDELRALGRHLTRLHGKGDACDV